MNLQQELIAAFGKAIKTLKEVFNRLASEMAKFYSEYNEVMYSDWKKEKIKKQQQANKIRYENVTIAQMKNQRAREKKMVFKKHRNRKESKQ